MLKMIIADDERVIRETISQMLDWESLGIELIGVCKNGIEVYNMIVDESPDIVMTDVPAWRWCGRLPRPISRSSLFSCPGMKSLNTPGKP